MKHVKVNGVWYDLAESAEGEHYIYSEDPIRPVNSAQVQGDEQDFQLRQDLLLWRLTDWSEGEGQLKFDPQQPGRSYVLQNVDPFSRPGMLGPGYRASVVQLGGGDLDASILTLGSARSTVYAVTTSGTPAIYSVSGTTATAGTAPPNPVAPDTVCGDGQYLWARIGTSIYQFDGSSWTQWNNQFGSVNTYDEMVELDQYLYYLKSNYGEVYELSKVTANTSTSETPIYEFDYGEGVGKRSRIAAGDGKLYFFTRSGFTTTIHEITPTSAAGTGYGRILTVIKGVQVESLWYDSGTVYFHGIDGDPGSSAAAIGTQRMIFYLDAEGSYGSLGTVRSLLTGPSDHGPSSVHFTQGYMGPATGGRLARTAFLLPPTDENFDYDDVAGGVFEVDGVTGGYAAVALYPSSITDRPDAYEGLEYNKGVYYHINIDDGEMYAWDTTLADNDNYGYAVSPRHDFNVVEEKILERIEVFCEDIPSGGGSVSIAYSIDGGQTWTEEADLISGAGETFGEWRVSTDSATVTFRDLMVRVKISDGTAKTWVTAVDVYARVVKKIRIWDLLLDATDDHAPQGYNGAKLIDNIKGISENTVIQLIDKYQSHDQQETGDEYDVTIDSFRVVLSQQGEGVIPIRLIEAEGTEAEEGGGGQD